MAHEVLSEDLALALEDICETCDLTESKIRAYIEEGVVDVQGDDVKQWRFSEVSIVQFQKAQRLEQDLRLNPAGVAIVLDLMSQIDELKNQLRRFEETS
ncbi:MAG: chaperone modulator CbpM [Fimbriimonadaceae bacterium]|nr:chaperone modulator CbpM [Alphaproteobacteria bacterium]